jgi:hypothetical protein
MNIVALVPLKNESWIIDTTFPILKKITDNILVANNNSNDNSLSLLEKYNTDLIESNGVNHSNKIRWELLDKSRELYGEKNLILCIDADEFITPTLFHKNLPSIIKHKSGTAFSSPWVQMWRHIDKYRAGKSVWNPKVNIKPFMFLDDGKVDYKRSLVINDHTSRIPDIESQYHVKLKFPLIHLQFANWKRSQLKQLWYQFNELMDGVSVNEINNKYAVASMEENLILEKVKRKWVKDIEIEKNIMVSSNEDIWYLEEINLMVTKYGSKPFEELNLYKSEYINNLLK